MKFGQFDTKQAGSEGRLWHLRHLGTKQFLFEEIQVPGGGVKQEPVGVLLRSIASKEVQEAVLENKRKTAKGEGGEDGNLAVAKALVVGFQHVHDQDGRLLTNSKEDLDWFFGLDQTFIQGALAFASEPGNFIGAE